MSNHTASDIARADKQSTPQPMTGTAFRRFRQEIPYSLSDLADRWFGSTGTTRRFSDVAS